ncbi:MAG: hypothetical protein ACFFEW_18595 [Candidatus Thorarchaeota archaeon]
MGTLLYGMMFSKRAEAQQVDIQKTSYGYTESYKPQNEKPSLMQRINRLMQRSTPDQILEEEYNNGTVQRVNYDNSTKTTNFDELVYQEDLEPKDRRPVLVMFYDNDTYARSEGDQAVLREAIIFKELANEYDGKVKFIVFEDDIDPSLVYGRNHGGLLEKYGIKKAPSIAMYSFFDLENGETPWNSDGTIKQVDILAGGPTGDKWIENKFLNCSFWWVDQHCLYKPNPDGDGKVYKHKNQYNIKELAGVFVK